MNKEILKIFNDFEVNGVKIPVKHLKYKGADTTYITFQEVNNNPALCCDDECEYSVKQYDFDIYTTGNYLNILKAVKKKLKENEFVWVEDGPDMYEDDTGYYHKTTTFEKEHGEE